MMSDEQHQGGDGQTTTNTNTVAYRAQPVVPMDIFTFQNLRMQPGYAPNSTKQINLYYWWGDHETTCPDYTQVTTVCIYYYFFYFFMFISNFIIIIIN